MDDDESSRYPAAESSDSFDDLTPELLSQLWGYLEPCAPGPSRILFTKAICRWSFGRKKDNINSVVLDALKISSQHCVITYQGNNKVTVLDMSSNGTWINGKKVGKGNSMELSSGDEICMGTTIPQPQNGGVNDYRYFYRHTADGESPGKFFEDFKLGFQLGKGAFAAVHEATHRSTGMKFAVKIMTPHSLLRSKSPVGDSAIHMAYTRIKREIDLMRQLEHPNICKLMQIYCDTGSMIHLILEFVNGGDLLSLIEKRGKLEERHARDITYQICDAVAVSVSALHFMLSRVDVVEQYIHSQGIVHRDLKPENILVTDEDHPIAKVADFGVARLVDGVDMLRTICGTPYYIAPELEDPNRVEGYDHKVDSWCMGVIVYAMLTGSQPFDTVDEVKFKARIIDWATLATVKGVDRSALYFVSDLLEKDPKIRLSLSNAHGHYWLKVHQPYHRNIAALYRSVEEEDRSEDPEGIWPFRFNGPIFAEHPATENSIDPARACSSLQRRSTVLAVAQEGGAPLRQPSVQMIINVARRSMSNASAGPSGVLAEHDSGSKRALSSIAEEVSLSTGDDIEMVTESPVRTPRPSRKKARAMFGSPRQANVNRSADKDVHMMTPTKTPIRAKNLALPKPIARRSSRINQRSSPRRH